MTLADIATEILEHKRGNPSHTATCGCLEAYIRVLWDQVTTVIGSPHPYDSLMKYHTARAMKHVLRRVMDPL